MNDNVDMYDSYTDDKYSNLNPADDIFDSRELYDEGGHVNPEVLAEKVDELRDQVEDDFDESDEWRDREDRDREYFEQQEESERLDSDD